jgi:uncharacterized protein (DUF427 family)
MTMTVGTGPFGHRPAGGFNFALPSNRIEYLEPFPRRIRALIGDEVVIDTIAAQLLHQQRRLPVWCFAPEDVRLEALPDDAVTAHEEGLARGLIEIRWDAVDEWLEEDEEVIVHPRDPYHRIEVRSTSRPVRVELDGELLAESTSALALFETSLPARWYLPEEDVRAELIPNSDVRTGCAYKGWASYYDVQAGELSEPFLAWYYRDPLDEVKRIRGRVCFFNERVDLFIDGERQERPQTQWSGTEWAKQEWARA